MTAVPTLTGPVEVSDLGFTLAHEHLFLLSPGVRANWPGTFDTDAEVDRAVSMLADAHALGVRSIVELTTVDLGRDIELMRAVAERSPVRVIAATGLHLRAPGFFNRRDPDQVTEFFLQDLQEGIAETGIRAGVVKIASSDKVTDQNRVHLRAAARAAKAARVPVFTHSDADARTGALQLDVFEEEGLDLSRVVVGHVGDSTDVEYLASLMDRGALAGMDRFGTGLGADLDERVVTITELCRRGYADRMVLAHDTSAYSDTFPWALRARRRPEWDFTLIPRTVLPALRAQGVGDDAIAAMTAGNIARLFGDSR